VPRSGFGLDDLLGGNVAKKPQGWQSLLLSRSRNNRAPPTMPTGHAHAGRARRKREAPSNVAEAAPNGASEPHAAALQHEDGVRCEREDAAIGGSRWRRCRGETARALFDRLTPELSRAAKRRRLGRIVRPHAAGLSTEITAQPQEEAVDQLTWRAPADHTPRPES
jgi:hypothetical protein